MRRIIFAVLIAALVFVGCQSRQDSPAPPAAEIEQVNLLPEEESESDAEFLAALEERRRMRENCPTNPPEDAPSLRRANLTDEQFRGVVGALVDIIREYEEGAIGEDWPGFMPMPQGLRFPQDMEELEFRGGVSAFGTREGLEPGTYIVQMMCVVGCTCEYGTTFIYFWLRQVGDEPYTFDVYAASFSPRELFFTYFS